MQYVTNTYPAVRISWARRESSFSVVIAAIPTVNCRKTNSIDMEPTIVQISTSWMCTYIAVRESKNVVIRIGIMANGRM